MNQTMQNVLNSINNMQANNQNNGPVPILDPRPLLPFEQIPNNIHITEKTCRHCRHQI